MFGMVKAVAWWVVGLPLNRMYSVPGVGQAFTEYDPINRGWFVERVVLPWGSSFIVGMGRVRIVFDPARTLRGLERLRLERLRSMLNTATTPTTTPTTTPAAA